MKSSHFLLTAFFISSSLFGQDNKIESTGNVGIGTINPEAKLNIVNPSAETIAWNDLTKSTLLIGSSTSGIGLDPNEIASNSGNLHIGTISEHSLVFRTGGANNRMIINAEGNVGIGTTTPNNPLSIAYNEGKAQLGFQRADSAENFYIGVTDTNEALFSNSSGGGDYDFQTNVGGAGMQSVLFVEGTNANIGIGTSSPEAKLNVVNPSSTTIAWNDLAKSTLLIGSSTSGMGLDPNEIASNSGNLHIGTISEHSIIFRTAGANNRMIIDAEGNVGIGATDTQGYKLGVNGKIAATEVKVALYNNWSDFVFYDDYSLPTLNEVEKHIQEKGHLKDIPNAEEVAENGILLGDMNAKLLQKIEELTLYTIAQEKEIEKQKIENKNIKEQLLELANRLEQLETK